MNNIMIDIETLDTKSSAVVLSIGAVKFDADTIGETFHMTLDVNDQAQRGRTISASTVQWWMKQSDAARQSVTQEGLSPLVVLENLSEFMTYGSTGLIKVWGNGTMFDNTIMLSLYGSYNLPAPWSYKGDRCYRTMLAEYRERHPEFQPVAPVCAHNALEDAIAQARTLQQIWNETT